VTQEKPGKVAITSEGRRVVDPTEYLRAALKDKDLAEGIIKSAPNWKFLHEEIAELRSKLADLQGQVVALQAKVFTPEEKVSPGPSEEVLEALRKKRERDIEDMEKEVDVDILEWERSWLSR